MKLKILILLLLVSSVCFGQMRAKQKLIGVEAIDWYADPWGYTYLPIKYRHIALIVDSTFHIRAGGATQRLRGGWTGAGALWVDSVNSRMSFYSGGVWNRLALFSEIGGGGSQTLQQVFNTQVGGSVLTKHDSIIISNSNFLDVLGTTSLYSFQNQQYTFGVEDGVNFTHSQNATSGGYQNNFNDIINSISSSITNAGYLHFHAQGSLPETNLDLFADSISLYSLRSGEPDMRLKLDGPNRKILLIADSILLQSTLSGAATGYVWTLKNPLTGSGYWGPSGGGSGNPNSNIGSGFRLAVPFTNNLKTLFTNSFMTLDSSSNSNGITIKPDTSFGKLATKTDVNNNYTNAKIDRTYNPIVHPTAIDTITFKSLEIKANGVSVTPDTTANSISWDITAVGGSGNTIYAGADDSTTNRHVGIRDGNTLTFSARDNTNQDSILVTHSKLQWTGEWKGSKGFAGIVFGKDGNLYAGLYSFNTSGTRGAVFNSDTTNGGTFEDQGTIKSGLKYINRDSTQWTDSTLIDKKYLNDRLAGVSGGSPAYREILGTDNILLADFNLECTGGTYTVTAPDPATNYKKEYSITNNDAGTITVTTAAGNIGLISSNYILNPGKSVTIVSNGVNYYIKMNN